MAWYVIFALGALAHMLFARAVTGGDRRDTPLHIACRRGNAKTVRYLLDRGADPNVFNFFRETPLLLACGADSSVIVKMLLDRAADANDSARPGGGALPWRDRLVPEGAGAGGAGEAAGEVGSDDEAAAHAGGRAHLRREGV